MMTVMTRSNFVTFRILGLDEQYLTDLAQYQCQAARLRARAASGSSRAGRPGHQCGPPAHCGPWSLVDRWKQGKKSLSQVRFMFDLSSCPPVVIISPEDQKLKYQQANCHNLCGTGTAHYRNKSCAKFTSRIIYVKRHFSFLRVFYLDNTNTILFSRKAPRGRTTVP